MTAIAWAILFAAGVAADIAAYQRPDYDKFETGIHFWLSVCFAGVIICTVRDLIR